MLGSRLMAQDDRTNATRRDFLGSTGAIIAASTLGRATEASVMSTPHDNTAEGAAPSPPIDVETVRRSERLAGVSFTDDERKTIAETIEEQLALMRRRQSLGAMPNELPPAGVFDPRLPGMTFDEVQRPLRWSDDPAPALPADDEAIAFAPIHRLSKWLHDGRLTSERLTGIYLDRLKRLGPTLECVIELTEDIALRQAQAADRDMKAGRDRGALHGIPWGAKDLLDTRGVRTTWGAAPYRDRIGESDAVVVSRLEEAGAVLVAKLTLGALAYGDIWYGGKTRSPWKLDRGSSGSSAGPAAATAAGLVGFSIGTETYGSIVSPCMRCGTTGLRPTFGRVPRTGAMALCWSLDKIGPICRTVEDCAMVLDAINGADDGDPSSVTMPFNYEADRAHRGVRVGYAPGWFAGEGADDLDRRALDELRHLGVEMTEVELPDLPYETLLMLLTAEAAAAFEDLTRSDRDDELAWQDPEAWPNTFRKGWFIPAVELIQVQRFRRQVMQAMGRIFENVDMIISPSYAASLLLITNNTGHPSLTLRTGFREDGQPRGITLWGRLFDEGRLCNVGAALERSLDVWHERPAL